MNCIDISRRTEKRDMTSQSCIEAVSEKGEVARRALEDEALKQPD
jgi:hypothetical protein